MCPGSSDLIGFQTITIGPEHLGSRLARFVAIEVNGATAAGIMLGYGWCNYLLEVRVSSNTIGILLVNAANNVNVVNAIVEANYGAGIVLQAGYQVNLEGNVIEGNKGPAIVAGGIFQLAYGHAGRSISLIYLARQPSFKF